MIYFREGGKVYRAYAVQDWSPEDPSVFSTSHMAFYHPRYHLGNTGAASADDVIYELRELVEDAGDDTDTSDMDFQDLVMYIHRNIDDVYIKPVYMYDHTGITISTVISWPDHQWDGCTIGAVYVTKDEVINTTGKSPEGWQIRADELIEEEIERYDLFLRDMSYGLVLEEKVKEKKHSKAKEEWEVVDTVYGFLSEDWGETLELKMLEEVTGKPKEHRYEESEVA